ncbi:LysR family transcriptional regulator [Cohnella abietis]|uniref:LysR family transcriptional regulator n=1 Tax=Cohnella abietis TaxID=2507935 RepID=A0A3T1DA03_9BACL|nr:LysR family transcriptional regulator [Cohnella abietis]BBI34932.1 LysR family transcriptional regulator [Cohnella abietis]
MKLLVLIDRYKQVTAVANSLGMKQPTISFHMKKMESEWGTKLFEAKAGRIFLTNAGKMLLPYAAQISALYSEAESKMVELRDNERNLFRIGCTDCAMTTLARSGWLQGLKDKIDVQVTVQTGNEEGLFNLLKAGMLDLVVCGQLPQESEDFQYESLTSTSMKLIVPIDHPLTVSDEIIAPHNLYKYPFIDHTERSISQLIATWKAQFHWNLQAGAKFESVEMIFSAVEAQLGLAILPECTLPDPARRVAALELPGHCSEWSLYASWKPNYWNTELMKQMVSSISL